MSRVAGAVPDPAVLPPREARARRAGLLAIAPLAAIAVAFLLPTWSSRDGLVRPPVAWLTFHPALALLTLAPCLVAALLLGAALLGRRSARGPGVVAWVAFVVLALATVLAGAAELAETLSGPETTPRAGLIGCALAALLLARAPWRPGWQRFTRLLGAYASLLALLVPVALAAAFGTSAWLFAAGVLALLGIVGWGLWPNPGS
ncbi:MAG: hypothetical protein IT370_25515 [Deltaproteobacteria bacterium]|nr:hypothetical protein [Deltaproteobacteria bacterium]